MATVGIILALGLPAAAGGRHYCQEGTNSYCTTTTTAPEEETTTTAEEETTTTTEASTTTTEEETTTTAAVVDSSTSVPETPTTTDPAPEDPGPPVLPFTGPVAVAGLGSTAAALIAGGLALIRRARKLDE